jgi:acyl-[acyl-carrier-protein] desaturase
MTTLNPAAGPDVDDAPPPASPVDLLAGGLLPPAELRRIVREFQERSGSRGWAPADLPWDELDPEQLTDEDVSAVRFITFIEDHIPGYLSYFLTAFPVTGRDLPDDRFAFNREYFRFLVGWAGDEERHASTLTDYQVRAGLADEDSLMSALAREGKKEFVLPYEHPLEAFTYTLIQEKATQLFYQRFAATVREPLLRRLLNLLARDEARHFAFYSSVVSRYLQVAPASSLRNMRDVVATFRMPLADTLHGYWRWSLRVADATSYDHTESYEALTRLVGGFAGAVGLPEREELLTLVTDIRRAT